MAWHTAAQHLHTTHPTFVYPNTFFCTPTGEMSKLQTEFSFPTRLKLARYLAKGVDGRSLPGGGQYELHAVLSHEGDAGSGHYRAYVLPRRDGNSNQWYEFDDTRVTPVREDVAVKQQYGGKFARGGGMFGLGCKPNAYMLVYVRKDLVDEDAIEPQPTGSLLHQEVRRAFERTLKGLGRGKPGTKKAKASPASRVGAGIAAELEAADTYL